MEDDKEEKLTKKEANEMRPRIKELLRVVFNGMDKGLTQLNRMKAEAYIWSSIDETELDVLAAYLVERGQLNPAMARITRTLSMNFTQYQLGIITIPRLIQSFKFVMDNGGVDNPFGFLVKK